MVWGWTPIGLLASVGAALAVLCWPHRRGRRAAGAEALRVRADQGRRRSGWQQVVAAARARLVGGAGQSGQDVTRWLPLLDQLSAALRVGLPPAEALALALRAAAVPVRDDLLGVLQAAREGRACGPAWLRVARSTSSTELALLARAWLVSARLGAPLADAVDNAAHAMRSHRELASALETATAGARTTALILTLLPVAGVGIALLMGVTPGELYASPAALVSLSLGVVLILIGRLVVARMIAAVEQ